MYRIFLLIAAFTIICDYTRAEDTKPERSSFISYELFPDAKGEHINAHGAGMLQYGDIFYLYGEFRTRGAQAIGVSCYKSLDLYNWENIGLVLVNVDIAGHDIEKGCLFERPKVIYNVTTKKFVLWFHLELKGHGYAAARTAVAVSDSPEGPFEYIKSFRPTPEMWPMNYSQEFYRAYNENIDKTGIESVWSSDGFTGKYLERDLLEGQMSRDMTLFVDSNGRAFHIAASEENQTIHIRELTDDYLDFTGRFVRVLPGASNEAPAICKYNGMYYLISSGCTGWAPNPARSAVAPTIWGPWVSTGNPCRGVNPHNNMGPEKTWGGQSTYLQAIPGKDGCYLAMFDIWRPHDQKDSRYLWLPAYIKDGRLIVTWQDKWALDWFDDLLK